LKEIIKTMPASDTQPLLVDVKTDLRERLILVAIKLFAEKGVEAVSMRTINAAAGTKNKSAVHYHFGNKAGILEAIFTWFTDTVEPVITDLWEHVLQREDFTQLLVVVILLVL